MTGRRFELGTMTVESFVTTRFQDSFVMVCKVAVLLIARPREGAGAGAGADLGPS